MSSVTDGYVKVRFRLDRDESGWPPAATEGLWAVPLGHDRYRLDNIPFFARLVSCEDVVRAMRGEDDLLWVEAVERYAGHSTIRIIAPTKTDIPEIRNDMAALGCASELFESCRLIAVDVPLEANLAAVRAFLAEGQAAGRWAYEESALAAGQGES